MAGRFPAAPCSGRYVGEQLGRGDCLRVRIQHRRASVVAVRSSSRRLCPEPLDGRKARSCDRRHRFHPSVAVHSPTVLKQALAGDKRLIADAEYPPCVGNHLGRTTGCLIVGAGLTMADIVASLDRRGHVGPITALSRHRSASRSAPLKPGRPEFRRFSGQAGSHCAPALRARCERRSPRAEREGLPGESLLRRLARSRAGNMDRPGAVRETQGPRAASGPIGTPGGFASPRKFKPCWIGAGAKECFVRSLARSARREPRARKGSSLAIRPRGIRGPMSHPDEFDRIAPGDGPRPIAIF